MTEQTKRKNELLGNWRIFCVLLLPTCLFLFNLPSVSAQINEEFGPEALIAGIHCLDDEEFYLAVDLLTETVENAKQEKDFATEMKGRFFLAHATFWLARYEQSLGNLNELISNFSDKLTQKDSVKILRLISLNHYYLGNYDVAHELALAQLKATEQMSDDYNIAVSHQEISEIAIRQKRYDFAMEHLQISNAMFEKIGEKEDLSFNLDLMGDIFHETGKYEQALATKIKSCQMVDTIGSLYNNAYCNHTIAATLSKMHKYDEAILLYNLALANWLKAGMPEETAQTRACLGEATALSGKCKAGVQLMEQALQEAECLTLSPLRRDILEKLYQVNKHCGHINEAFAYLERYIAVNDSLNNQNTQVRIASLSNGYELEKRDAEVEVLKQKEQVKSQYIASLLVSFVLLLVSAIIGYYLLKKQRSYSHQLNLKSEQIAQQYAELNQTNEKLTAANKELEQFAYIASHDLKSPLRTIGNYSSLIKRRYGHLLDENGITFLAFITDAAKHMNNLLEDIFIFSKLGKNEIEFSEVSLQEKLELSLKLLNGTVRSRHAKIKSDALPIVQGNPTQLYQLIQNLLDNALKFIPKDRKPQLEIKLADEGEFYRISFRDNGIGIAENKQEEVFTIFKRLHSREEYIGTGIGLAICKKIVEGHGGRIWIESDGISGTTFHFTLKKMPLDVSLAA